MKILLINPPCGDRTIGLKNLARIEPLGLELIGAGVSSEHEVRLVDMMVRPSDLEATLEEFTPDVAGVRRRSQRCGPCAGSRRSASTSWEGITRPCAPRTLMIPRST